MILIYACAIFFTLTCECLPLEREYTPNVGTVLFSATDAQKKQWSKSEIGLLQARRYFQNLLPPPIFVNTFNEELINALLRYFRDAYVAIKKEAKDPETDTTMTTALSDTIGGYLKVWVLPVAKLDYYGGTISQDNVIKLFQFYNEIKRYLNTDGEGWHKPDEQTLNSITINVAPLQFLANTRSMKDPCENLAYFEKTPSGLTIPIPNVSWNDKSSTLFVPLKNATLVMMSTPDTSNNLVKYYNTARSCIQTSNPKEQEIFDRKFQKWLLEEVIPHLKDENLYLALGSVLTLVNKTRDFCNSALDLYVDKYPTTCKPKKKPKIPCDISCKKIWILTIILIIEVAWCVPALLFVLCSKKKDCSSHVYLFIDSDKKDRDDMKICREENSTSGGGGIFETPGEMRVVRKTVFSNTEFIGQCPSSELTNKGSTLNQSGRSIECPELYCVSRQSSIRKPSGLSIKECCDPTQILALSSHETFGSKQSRSRSQHYFPSIINMLPRGKKKQDKEVCKKHEKRKKDNDNCSPKDGRKPEQCKDYRKPERSKDCIKPEPCKDYRKPEKSKDCIKPEPRKDYRKPERSKDCIKPEPCKDYRKPEKSKDCIKPEPCKDYRKPEKSKDCIKPDQRKLFKERKKEEEERKKREKLKKLEECKKHEERKQLEECKKNEERKKLEESEMLEECKRISERKKLEEFQKLEECKKIEERKQIEELKKLEECKKIEERKQIEELKKLEECKKIGERNKRDECNKKHKKIEESKQTKQSSAELRQPNKCKIEKPKQVEECRKPDNRKQTDIHRNCDECKKCDECTEVDESSKHDECTEVNESELCQAKKPEELTKQKKAGVCKNVKENEKPRECIPDDYYNQPEELENADECKQDYECGDAEEWLEKYENPKPEDCQICSGESDQNTDESRLINEVRYDCDENPDNDDEYNDYNECCNQGLQDPCRSICPCTECITKMSAANSNVTCCGMSLTELKCPSNKQVATKTTRFQVKKESKAKEKGGSKHSTGKHYLEITIDRPGTEICVDMSQCRTHNSPCKPSKIPKPATCSIIQNVATGRQPHGPFDKYRSLIPQRKKKTSDDMDLGSCRCSQSTESKLNNSF
ncbi:hypothetical protein PYW08_002589 [Mythimna loreyi]|uniref:Uncharacterized protein n=1 Tax=Mythimna loreyi TaxID=667449 RepID=A0ACC2QKC3_9NEOP|nr:hypothetical protein PYW08_002589 [Mythimna loreyi]